LLNLYCQVSCNFKLLKELEKGEKGISDKSCSYGLEDGDNAYMTHWSGTIIGSGHVGFFTSQMTQDLMFH